MDRASPLRVIREHRQGTVFARCAGIEAARAPLLVFLDDDNHFDSNYLEEALRIAREQPSIGAFGGVARCLAQGRIPVWKQALLPYLGIRDYGYDVITSSEDRWGEWEPIGAGMVFRRVVGQRFVELVRSNPDAQRLGRRGGAGFICGEDSLLARMTYQLGYACSYQPSLRLTHFIRSSRLTAWHLARTLEGTARAFVIYEHVLGRPAQRCGFVRSSFNLLLGCARRIRSKGLQAGFVEWFWDLGYFLQTRSRVYSFEET